MGVAFGIAGLEADGLEHLHHAFLAPGAPSLAVDLQGLGDDGADRQARVERSERVLEHQRDRAPHRFQPAPGKTAEVAALEADGAGVGPVKLGHGARAGGLAAAAFTDQRQGLAAIEGEADAVDGMDPPALAGEQHRAFDGEVLDQPLDLEKGGIGPARQLAARHRHWPALKQAAK